MVWAKPQILDLQQNKGPEALLFGRLSKPYGRISGDLCHIRSEDHCFI